MSNGRATEEQRKSNGRATEDQRESYGSATLIFTFIFNV